MVHADLYRVGGARRAGRARLGRDDGGADRARRMAGAGRDRAEARPARHRARPRARAQGARTRLPRGTGGVRAAPRARCRRSSALARAQRLGRGAARADAGRCLDARLRAAGQADRRDGDPDDLAAAAGRAAGAARQALQRDRASSPRPCTPSWPWTGACAASASARPRSTARISRAGLLILEDLGSEPVVDADGPIPERYARGDAAAGASCMPRRCRAVLPVAEGSEHALPPYDLEALLIEVELLARLVCARTSRHATCRARRGPSSSISGARRLDEISPGRRPGPCATTIRRT